LSFAVSPRSAKTAPARFTAHGHIGLAYTTSAALGCHGTVSVSYYRGSTKVASTRAAVNASCAYGATTRIRGLVNDHARITVKLRFNGNNYAAPSSTRTTFVTIH